MNRLISNLVFLSLSTLTSLCDARSLYWESLSVTAHLDNQGSLHVTEQQHIVFDGSWNGGQRNFRLEPGQKLLINEMRRINPNTGEIFQLTKGDLDYVDHYQLKNRTDLYWRSRKPTDPPFQNTGLVYEIEYI